jgi:hypothetical protein
MLCDTGLEGKGAVVGREDKFFDQPIYQLLSITQSIDQLNIRSKSVFKTVQTPIKIRSRSVQDADPSKIRSRSVQNPANIRSRSIQNPIELMSKTVQKPKNPFKIRSRPVQDPFKIRSRSVPDLAILPRATGNATNCCFQFFENDTVNCKTKMPQAVASA